MTIGERITFLREGKNLSQKEFANLITMNNSVLSRVEAGTRPVRDDEIVKIAEVLDVSTDFLLGFDSTQAKDNSILVNIINDNDVSKDELLLAAHVTKDLTKDEQKQLIQFAKFLKTQRKSNT